MKKFFSIFAILFILLSFGCAMDIEQDVKHELDKEVSNIMILLDNYNTSKSNEDLSNLKNYIKEYDKKYNSNLYEEFNLDSFGVKTKASGGSDLEPNYDLPFEIDGAIYLKGGDTGLLSSALIFGSPTVTEGQYFHSGVLDIDLFDPSNLEMPCIQSANPPKGSEYETPMKWMESRNVAIMVSKNEIDKESMDNAQLEMDYYCNEENQDTSYSFFYSYVNLAKPVPKDDMNVWYCNKVPWKLYNSIGIEIDSNSNQVDWTDCGLYTVVKTYYYARYWYNWGKARKAINEYMDYVKEELIIAEEIYFSDNLEKVYEDIRN